jgi:hypothetical protein
VGTVHGAALAGHTVSGTRLSLRPLSTCSVSHAHQP